MKIWIVVALAMTIGACTTSTPIRLQHTETGKIVDCGPFTARDEMRDLAIAQKESQCIKDFQRQGYERMP